MNDAKKKMIGTLAIGIYLLLSNVDTLIYYKRYVHKKLQMKLLSGKKGNVDIGNLEITKVIAFN